MLRINFLPSALRPKLIVNLDVLFLSTAAVSTVLCLGLFMSVQSKSRRSQMELTQLQSQADEQHRLIDELRSKEAQRDLSATQSMAAKRLKWNPFLKELTYLLPRDVWVGKMSVKNSGDSVDMDLLGLAPSQKAVNRFLATMERAPSFQNVRLNSSTLKENFNPVLYAFDFTIPDLLGTHVDRAPASDGAKKK